MTGLASVMPAAPSGTWIGGVGDGVGITTVPGRVDPGKVVVCGAAVVVARMVVSTGMIVVGPASVAVCSLGRVI